MGESAISAIPRAKVVVVSSVVSVVVGVAVVVRGCTWVRGPGVGRVGDEAGGTTPVVRFWRRRGAGLVKVAQSHQMPMNATISAAVDVRTRPLGCSWASRGPLWRSSFILHRPWSPPVAPPAVARMRSPRPSAGCRRGDDAGPQQRGDDQQAQPPARLELLAGQRAGHHPPFTVSSSMLSTIGCGLSSSSSLSSESSIAAIRGRCAARR